MTQRRKDPQSNLSTPFIEAGSTTGKSCARRKRMRGQTMVQLLTKGREGQGERNNATAECDMQKGNWYVFYAGSLQQRFV